MNLHDARFTLRNIAIWVTVWGANGRYIGNHAWVLPEGDPPTDVETRPTWRTYGWQPRRFSWMPFDVHNLFRNRGYHEPLCGHRSASRRPRAEEGHAHNGCRDCLRVAAERGIVVLTHDEATQNSPARQAIQREHLDWIAAGRPDQWPASTT